MYYSEKLFAVRVWVVTGAALLLFGCASTSPNAKFKEPLLKGHHVNANDNASVKIEAGQGVTMEEFEKQRIARRIEEKINDLKARNAGVPDKREFELAVIMTRYEKGNAFTRAMIAGLGRIHIDAKVEVLKLPERIKVSEFEIDKTFAWGGIYGAVTSIEDVEKGFAEGVAKAVTNVKE